ncbi:COG4315 family predicted lipoprotein [Nocardia vermiculata]|uniref:Lipoprotein n=1 Tax=Nocardia vermiculata TaxID=257274 RepID=A0A846Y802_9NOCA|nr:hypothetical protein [Nocardia vermiculata]NKY53992.1 hypothetical protein [Nocardia vermiculata]
MKTVLTLLFSLITVATVAACGTTTTGPPVGGPQPLVEPKPGPVVIGLHEVRNLGPVLVDARGYTLYLFPADTAGSLGCSDACLGSWPPVIVPDGEDLRAGNGVHRNLLATMSGPDGERIATYAGHPLYAYAGDVDPGQANGQGLNLNGDSWFVVNADGKALVPPDQQGVMPEGTYLVSGPPTTTAMPGTSQVPPTTMPNTNGAHR